jgi:hypothetical protein
LIIFASPDLLREMIKGFAQRMMDAEVEALCGAVSAERVNSQRVPAAPVGYPGGHGACCSFAGPVIEGEVV